MPHFQMLEKFHNPTIFLLVSFNLDLKFKSANNLDMKERKMKKKGIKETKNTNWLFQITFYS